jgi:hypothetical protein
MKASLATRNLAVFVVFAVLPALAREPNTSQNAVLWTDPGDVQSRDLFWGPGGQDHQPKLPVSYLQEDMHGSSPKFDVKDAEDKKWSAKLGLEAKPETVASRLMWAVGFEANLNYFVPQLHVENMPFPLRRGHQFISRTGDVRNVRLQRHPEHMERIGDWNWRHNQFYGTREFNGLRVMMALIGNWDLKDNNNVILEDKKDPGREIFAVSDVGTAMGTPGKSYDDRVSKGNLKVYRRTKLIAHVHDDYVDLNFPKRPPWTELFEFEWVFYFHQVHMGWVGKHIPRADAKWIGSLLAQLKPEQIREAFRAGGYSDQEIDAYTQAVISRIRELTAL